MEIGSIIRSRRAARGLTQEQVAQALKEAIDQYFEK